ncbi:type VII secretion-associated serine protease mycosin [Nonomuraea angiospora]|uniref:type VII secretion-associated serine protease mycosin n=1 Tax=Nonomuraea angiospora TaxID=46172 RepID=UPI0029ACC6A5|nr:type VII secretion-associated serine protease mycosin [Nonomuraea angiospora]MDX3106463.1 type VII secretion-associated serine protease mycosin [Nonomuraea angiospora]
MPFSWYGAAAIGLVLTLTPTPAPTSVPTSVPTSGPTRTVTCDPEPGVAEVTGKPWPQERLRFERVWRFTRGEGVTVAVVDSGVDATHPQLAGAVTTQVDLTGTDLRDCVGHGTAVAGIIAGRDLTARGVPVMGVAPAARILSIKQTEGSSGDVSRLAQGIRRAAELGAEVINVSVQAHDHPALKAAVAYAQAKDAVIVAAAGNVRQDDGVVTPAYPAEYPGVIAVGAASPDGGKSEFSNSVTRISVTAPGAGITSAWTGGGYRTELDGTSFAAPFVAGVAALVRARHPELDHWQVKRRLERTADGGGAAGTGAGLVNPLLAVTSVQPDAGESAPAAPPIVLARAPVPDPRTRGVAMAITAGAVGATALVVFLALTLPRARRRGWRAGGAQTFTGKLKS